jgi:hypothetical protein
MNWLKIVKWLLPSQNESSPSALDNLQKSLASKFSSLPRRWLIVLFFITFASLGTGWRAAWNDLRHSIWPSTNATSSSSAGATNTVPVGSPGSTNTVATSNSTNQGLATNIQGAATNLKKMEWWPFVWRNLKFVLSLAYWLLLSGLISLAITATVDRAKSDLREELLVKAQNNAERLELVARILRHSGISNIYDAVPRKAVKEQSSAQHIIEAVTKAKSLRMMTIAGFEYIGKGRDSLLFETISKNSQVKLEIILLDATKADHIIKERVRTVGSQDSGYTEETLKREIDSTKERLLNLKSKGMDVNLWLCRKNPVSAS